MFIRLFSLFLCFLITASPAFADAITLPYSYSPGQVITAAKLNANNQAITDQVNGNLSDANVKVGAAIAPTKIDFTQGCAILRAAAANGLTVGTTGDTVPRLAITSEGAIHFGPGGGTARDIQIMRKTGPKISIRNEADSADADLTAGALTLGTALKPENGGSGNTVAATLGTILVGDGTKFAPIGPGTSGQVPVSNGTTITMGSPSSGAKYTVITKSAGFTANDATGTIYVITASSAIAVTLPASPADGTVYKFAIASGTAGVTFTANGAETIINGGSVATTMTLASQRSGVVELVAVSGGWYVT